MWFIQIYCFHFDRYTSFTCPCYITLNQTKSRYRYQRAVPGNAFSQSHSPPLILINAPQSAYHSNVCVLEICSTVGSCVRWFIWTTRVRGCLCVWMLRGPLLRLLLSVNDLMRITAEPYKDAQSTENGNMLFTIGPNRVRPRQISEKCK